MNFNLIITLLVMVFMIVSFVIQKWSYGLTAMTCVVVLTLAGVIDVQTAFSGFSNTTTILIATMIVIAGQLSRTSLISRIRSLMTKAQDKGGILLILLICAFTALLTQLMGMTAVMAIMLLFVQTLKDDDASGISQSKMIFLCATMICTWFGRFPIGMGAALPLTTNAYYEGLVGGDSTQLLGIFDFMKVGLLPSIIGTIYCLFAWRLVPKQELRTDAIDLGAAGKQGGRATMSQTHEMIVYLGLPGNSCFLLLLQSAGQLCVSDSGSHCYCFYLFRRYDQPRSHCWFDWRYDLDGSWRSGILYRSESVWCRRVHRGSGSEAFGQQSKRTDGNHCLYSSCNSYDYFYVE